MVNTLIWPLGPLIKMTNLLWAKTTTKEAMYQLLSCINRLNGKNVQSI